MEKWEQMDPKVPTGLYSTATTESPAREEADIWNASPPRAYENDLEN